MTVHRKELPHSIQAERTVLGMLLLYPFTLSDAKGLKSEYFYREAHQYLFDLIVHLADESKPFDPATLIERIGEGPRKKNGVARPHHRGKPTDGDHWELYGGMQYLLGLGDDLPSSENIEFYVTQIRDYAESRFLMEGGRAITEDLARGYLAPTEAREKLLDLAILGGSPITQESAHISEAVAKVDADVDAELRGELEVFVGTGIMSLDDAHDFGGLTTQGVTYIIGASGMGKTSLINRLALGMAKRGMKVYLYGTETDMYRRTRDLKFSLAAVDLRWWSNSIKTYLQAKENHRHIPQLEDQLFNARAKIKQAGFFISQLPIIVNNSGRSVDEVAREIRQYHRQGECDIAFLDYLQDFSTSKGIPPDTSSQAIHASRTLKELSSQLTLPVVVGAQRAGEQELNAKLAEATDRTMPGLIGRLVPTQIQWTSKAKQDAEEVFSLYRRDYYADLYPDIAHMLPGHPGCIELVARKRRAGPLSKWLIDFHGPTKWCGKRTSLLDIHGAPQ